MFRFRRSVSGGGRRSVDSSGGPSVVSVGGQSVVSVGSQSRSRSRNIPQIYGPENLEDGFLQRNAEEDCTSVLAKIEKCYSRLKNPELGYGGYCFGLLDPTSNIFVNSVLAPDTPARVAARRGENAPDMIQRSLDGLLAFLTRLFPYLPEVEAVQYLDAAEADPLLASLLIINRRGIEKSFRLDSDTTVAAVEASLRCAAVAAQHPDPQKIVLVWKLVSARLKMLRPKLQLKSDKLLLLMDPGESDPVLQLNESWELAESRLHHVKPRSLPLTRAARKRMLLATIHRFYLQAMARLPKDELCSRYHHSLLKAGNCYGPLDPVSNIIINTIWYDKVFPPSKRLTIQMISTSCLQRIVVQSFYGLVSFMCTRYPDRTADQILHMLQVANADLRVADPTFGVMLQVTGKDISSNFSGDLRQAPSFRNLAYEATKSLVGGSTSHPSLQVAYNAAATAACHPAPSAQQALLGSPDLVFRLQFAHMHVLRNDHLLTSENVNYLASSVMLTDDLHQQPQPEPKKVNNAAYTVYSHRCLQFWGLHNLVLRSVGIALAKFNIDKVHKYTLHFICGVNRLVSGPEYDPTLGYKLGNPSRYHHSHINFLATCEDPQSARSPATLFFAECGNYNTDESWCIPVNPLDRDTEHVRCMYCEFQATTIVHPAVDDFHGRDTEFEKVLRGEPLLPGLEKNTYHNDRLYSKAPDLLGSIEDDYIYSDTVLDPEAPKVGPEELHHLFLS